MMPRRFLVLPGFRPNLTQPNRRKITVGIGSSSELVGNTTLDLLGRKMVDFPGTHPKATARCLGNSREIDLTRSNDEWCFDPSALLDTTGSSRVRFTLSHPNLPESVYEDVDVISILDSEPIIFRELDRTEDDLSISRVLIVEADQSWLKQFDKIEVYLHHKPGHPHDSPHPFGPFEIKDQYWVDITNSHHEFLSHRPLALGPRGVVTYRDRFPRYYLVRAGGRKGLTMPFCRSSIYPHIIFNGTFVPALVDIFSLEDDDEWLKYAMGFPQRSFTNHLKNNFQLFRKQAIEPDNNYRSIQPCQPGSECVLCKAKEDFGRSRPGTLLKRLRRALENPTHNPSSIISAIPSGVRPILASAVMLGDLWGYVDEIGPGPFRGWAGKYAIPTGGKPKQEVTLTRGGVFYDIAREFSPMWNQKFVTRTHLGWTSGIPLRMTFWDNRNTDQGAIVTVNWMGLSR